MAGDDKKELVKKQLAHGPTLAVLDQPTDFGDDFDEWFREPSEEAAKASAGKDVSTDASISSTPPPEESNPSATDEPDGPSEADKPLEGKDSDDPDDSKGVVPKEDDQPNDEEPVEQESVEQDPVEDSLDTEHEASAASADVKAPNASAVVPDSEESEEGEEAEANGQPETTTAPASASGVDALGVPEPITAATPSDPEQLRQALAQAPTLLREYDDAENAALQELFKADTRPGDTADSVATLIDEAPPVAAPADPPPTSTAETIDQPLEIDPPKASGVDTIDLPVLPAPPAPILADTAIAPPPSDLLPPPTAATPPPAAVRPPAATPPPGAPPAATEETRSPAFYVATGVAITLAIVVVLLVVGVVAAVGGFGASMWVMGPQETVVLTEPSPEPTPEPAPPPVVEPVVEPAIEPEALDTDNAVVDAVVDPAQPTLEDPAPASPDPGAPVPQPDPAAPTPAPGPKPTPAPVAPRPRPTPKPTPAPAPAPEAPPPDPVPAKAPKQVKIITKPPALKVKLDGVTVGRSNMKLQIDPGTHTITISDGKAEGIFTINYNTVGARLCFETAGRKVKKGSCK